MNFSARKIDETDLEILSCLKANSRLSASAISAQTGMSISAVIDRIKKLETAGVIKQYTMLIDVSKIGFDVCAFVEISTSDRNYISSRATIRALVETHPEIIECHAVTGSSMFIMKINAATMNDLERLIGEIQTCDGEIQTKTSIVLNTMKHETFSNLP